MTRYGTLALLVLSLAGCMDRSADELLTPIMPSVTLRWPRSGDALPAGRREILYTFDSPRGAASYDLVVNDSLLASFPAGSDGSQPAIMWNVDTALVATGARYFLRVFDHDGNVATSGTMTNIRVVLPTAPPAAPRGLSVWTLTATAVNLSWEDAAGDETGYELWRAGGTGALARIMVLPPNSISVNDTGLTPGALYRYRVRAVNAFGFGESNEVSVGSGVPVLNPPAGLVATARGTRMVVLEWTDNSSGELGFVIQRRVSSGTVYSQIGLVGPNEQTFTDTTGLTGGSSFTYRVAARGQFSTSAWSNEGNVTTLYQDVFPPSNLSGAYDAASRSVKLAWKDNTIFELQTRIERRMNPTGLYAEVGRTGVDVIAFRDSAVAGGSTYTYRVRAYAVGDYYTDYSNEFTISVPGTAPPPAPAGAPRAEGTLTPPRSRR